MFLFLVIVIIIACVAMGFFILIQNPKGGGLSGTFGGAANQLFGYKRSTDDIERFTWYTAIAVFVLSMATVAFTTQPTTAANPSGDQTIETPADLTPDFAQPADNGGAVTDTNAQ